MEKRIDGHLVGFGSAAEVEEYEDHFYMGGAMTLEKYNAYEGVPSKDECDRICAEKSGEVVVWKIKKPHHDGFFI